MRVVMSIDPFAIECSGCHGPVTIGQRKTIPVTVRLEVDAFSGEVSDERTLDALCAQCFADLIKGSA